MYQLVMYYERFQFVAIATHYLAHLLQRGNTKLFQHCGCLDDISCSFLLGRGTHSTHFIKCYDLKRGKSSDSSINNIIL